MENNKPSWHDAAYKLSLERNRKVEDYTPQKGLCLKDFEPETYEKNKELLAEFETRVKNSFAHLAAIYHDKEIVHSVLRAYHDAVSKSSLFIEIAEKDAALYIELKRIFLMGYYDACKNVGKNYEEYKFL